MLSNILISLAVNLVSSFVFLYLVLYMLRPKISICNQIVRQKSEIPGEANRDTYVFKIVNKSMFDAFDIQLELFSLKQIKVTSNGINERSVPLSLKLKEIKHIPPYMKTRVCKKRSYAKHAVLFRSFEDIDSILKDENQTIQLQITLRHGLTGLSRVYKTDYISHDDIIEGQFEFGNSIGIKKK